MPSKAPRTEQNRLAQNLPCRVVEKKLFRQTYSVHHVGQGSQQVQNFALRVEKRLWQCQKGWLSARNAGRLLRKENFAWNVDTSLYLSARNAGKKYQRVQNSAWNAVKSFDGGIWDEKNISELYCGMADFTRYF